MSARHPEVGPAAAAATVDWDGVVADLGARGNATIERLLAPAECDALSALYTVDPMFRSRVVMASHGYGRGEYRYFAYPLPGLIAELRESLYARLAPLANQWNAAMGIAIRYPERHADFLERCHAAGQRPRMQSRPEVVPLHQGDAAIFAVHHRPVAGPRGAHRVNHRHGVSRIRSGHRHTLGIIFHDAR